MIISFSPVSLTRRKKKTQIRNNFYQFLFPVRLIRSSKTKHQQSSTVISGWLNFLFICFLLLSDFFFPCFSHFDFFSWGFCRKETSPVSDGLEETTTEMKSSSASKKTPTPAEIDEFLTELEEKEDEKQKKFIEKWVHHFCFLREF